MSNPGWWRDPQGGPFLRWWDGRAWTEHTSPLPPAEGGAASPSQAPYAAPQAQPLWDGQHASPAATSPAAAPERRGRGWLLALILGGVALVAVIVLVVAVVVPLFSRPDAASAPAPTEGAESSPSATPTPATVYALSERPGYADMESFVTGTYEKYLAAREDGSIRDLVPDTDDADDYINAFLLLLSDERGALRWAPSGTNPDELDAIIQATRDRVAEYERRFLAGEDLGVSVRVVRSDGSVFESDGAAPRADAAELARDYTASPGPDGTYVDSAEELASYFGMSLTFDYASMYESCGHSDVPLETIIATYCSATPELVYVNPDYSDYDAYVSSPAFVNSIRHEIAHDQIAEVCGTVAPPVAGAQLEAVTNSYAVLFLGADRAEFDARANGEYAAYRTTAETDRVAQLIHDDTVCQ
ncbi:DUF2510 domain-containing protein [Microbacterium marinilacus]|uniref:DUF2510 domain-containing protein n=1 Tax=Microbacterium marinilacus TaxID=415209 RepID=A0ABP7BI11_9MICO|nr:DUF2510 domain-containing protein [Microbacterium marinilacus]MBY0689501.1 DUF2510 domain-containing protein [Microbacterium marinilacus]